MKTYMLCLYIFLIASPLGFTAELPPDLTLEEAIETALQNNPNITIAKERIAQAEVDLREARRRFKPNLSIHAGYNPTTENRGIGLAVSQDLDRLLGSNRKEREWARLNLKIAKQELLLTIQKVTEEVTQAYLNYQLAKETLTLKKELVEHEEANLDMAQSKFDLGEVSLDSILSAKKELSQAKLEFLKAQHELKKSQIILYQTLGLKDCGLSTVNCEPNHQR